jgi:hypothetical protein
MRASWWRWLVAVAFLQLGVVTSSLAERYEGRYVLDVSGLGGETLELREDGTFAFTSAGCFGPSTIEGTWEEIAPNVIATTSFDRAQGSHAKSWREAAAQNVAVTVLDLAGSVLPGATVTLLCDDSEIVEGSTDARGEVELPACAPENLFVNLDGFESLNLDAPAVGDNRFVIALKEGRLLIENERWLLLDGQLYQLGVGLSRQTEIRDSAD